jgi:ABC-type glycerol-3-phosphate transport system substrate-binding protein
VKTFPNPSLNFLSGSNISQVTGKTYSAPLLGASPSIELWVNTKVFKDAGLVDSSGSVMIPQTFDDVLTASRTIKKQSNGSVYGYGFGAKLPYQDIWLTDMVASLSSDGSVGAGMNLRQGKHDEADNPVYQQLIEWLVTMKNEGHIIPDSSSVDDEGIRFLFSQNKFGMLLGGIWVVAGWQQTTPGFKDYTMDHAPLIGTTDFKGAYYTGPGGTQFSINNKTKNKDAAWSWFKWIYSKPAGERWVKAGNGISIFPDALKDEYAQDEATRNYFRLSKNLVKVSPQTGIRNPDTNQVKPAAVTPAMHDIVRGAFTGQITDVAGALRKLQNDNQKALEQGITDANNAGAHVSLSDYTFPDWDPTKDYVTVPDKK